MTTARIGTLAFLIVFFFAIAYAAEEIKTGIVKGTITIGGKPAAGAVVSVEGLPPELMKSKGGAESSSALMDQREMKFIPRVIAILAGTKVSFPNNDKTWHNVFSTSEAKTFDLGLYAPGKSREITFDKPGVVKILCNVHPDMETYVVVKAHPYFSATDKQGGYQVKALPLGKYRLEIWHPEFGTKVVPFEMAREGEVLAIDVDLKKQR